MKRSSFNVLFFLKKTKLLKNGEASVCMRITVDGTRVENNIRKSIDPSLWSQAKESARGKSRKSCDLNAYIENAKIKLHQIFNELEEEQQPHQRPREPVERKPPAPQPPSRPEAEAHRSQNQHPHSGCKGTTFPSSGGLSPHPVSLRPARFTYALAVGRHPRHAKAIALSQKASGCHHFHEQGDRWTRKNGRHAAKKINLSAFILALPATASKNI